MVPTMSTIASVAPTSCRWILSLGSRCTRASASTRVVNAAMARRRTSADSRLPSTMRAMSRRPRSRCGDRSISTSTLVPDRPPRVTRRVDSRYPPTGSFLSCVFRWAASTPRSTSAPRNMSPLTPEKQSR